MLMRQLDARGIEVSVLEQRSKGSLNEYHSRDSLGFVHDMFVHLYQSLQVICLRFGSCQILSVA